MSEEIYNDIVGYKGLYQISNTGKVKSLFRLESFPSAIVKGGNFIRKRKEKILSPAPDKDGYLRVVLCKDGILKNFFVHRLVISAFKPNLSNFPEVNHIDGNKLNNCVDNLEWCSPSHNNYHRYRLNLVNIENQSGENHWKTTLKKEDVLKIREKWNSGRVSQLELVTEYKISQSTVSRIVNKQNWRHL